MRSSVGHHWTHHWTVAWPPREHSVWSAWRRVTRSGHLPPENGALRCSRSVKQNIQLLDNINIILYITTVLL